MRLLAPLLFLLPIALSSQADIGIRTQTDAFTGDVITTTDPITWSLDHKYGGNGLQFVAHKNNDDLYLTAVVHTGDMAWIRTGDNIMIKMADGRVITLPCMLDASSDVKSLSLFTAYPLYRISAADMGVLASGTVAIIRVHMSDTHIDFLPGRKSMPDDCRAAFAGFLKKVGN